MAPIFATVQIQIVVYMVKGQMELVVAGVNFHNAGLDIRNKFAFTTDNIKGIYNNRQKDSHSDFFILSTCNRTEIYSSTLSGGQLLQMLASNNHILPGDIAEYAFVKTGDDAIRHLFRVAAGLDSQILGDYEIIGQLKNAFTLAKSYNCSSGYVEKIVNGALKASRQIKSNTSLSDGTTSISYATIQLLKQYGGQQGPLNICLMGLGKIGTLTLKNLKHYLPQHHITLVNRNEEKAQFAAGEYAVNYAPFSLQQAALADAHVLIVATGAGHPIISKGDIDGGNIRLIFDLSVPSNVNADVRGLSGVTVYNIDELSQLVNETIAQRKGEIPLAEKIVLENFNEFKEWEQRRNRYSNITGGWGGQKKTEIEPATSKLF